MRLYSFASSSAARLFQFTHPGKGATVGEVSGLNIIAVSIHAPWEGCDRRRSRRSSIDASFNSRTLGRVRRGVDRIDVLLYVVSIHAPWEGCDPPSLNRISFIVVFQFTHPGKGATTPHKRAGRTCHVSIHAPWEGCDLYPDQGRSYF